MKEDLLRIESKVDRLDQRLGNIDITLTKQEQCLQTHIRRTELAEQRLDKIDIHVERVMKHTNYVEGVLKFFGVLGAGSALFVTLFEALKLFFH